MAGIDERAILAQERRALDSWSRGDPLGYITGFADDATYFDDIGAQRRRDGVAAVRGHFTSLQGKVPPHRYELVNPKVQIYGEVGVLSMRYETFAPDGKPLTPWNATVVYRRSAGEWRVVHAHWSMLKQTE